MKHTRIFTDIHFNHIFKMLIYIVAKRGLELVSYRGVLLSTFLHATVCLLHSLLNVLVWIANTIFFFLIPNLFAICNNTFSKWWEGLRMSCGRVLSSTLLLVRFKKKYIFPCTCY
jgi:hypothetical protein